MIQAQKSQLMTEIFSQKTPREEWKTVKIKDVFDIKRGYVLKASETSKEQTNDYVYPVYSSQTLNDGLMGYWNEYLYENAITWTTDGAYAGTVRYRQGKFYCTNVCGVLIPKVEHIDAKFVSYILGTIAPNHVVKVGNPKLMNNVMAEIEIPLPPLAEQKKIAKILSEYDELIEANDKKSENLRKSRSQLMNSIFTERESLEWNTVKLGDVCTVNSGKGIKKSEYVEDGIYSIIGANGEIGRCNYFNNDKPVLTTGRVGTIGTIQKVNKAWITDNTLIVDIKDSRVTYDFLYYAMGTIDFEKIKTGNAQPLVTAGRLKEVEIKVPNLVEQQRISKVLSDYDSLTFTLDEEIEVLKNTKNQLMNNIFN